MRRSDPFSTPARRRRIIAEVAKAALRKYCITACENVIVFRNRTAAAVAIQCALRKGRAQRKVKQMIFVKKTKAAVLIQTRIRIRIAKLCRMRRFRERLLMWKKRLANVVTNLYNYRKQRMARIAMLIALRLAREKKELRAATNMQRMLRGHFGRLKYMRLDSFRLAARKRRNDAAVLIQSHMRRLKAMKWYKYWCRRKRAVVCVQRTVSSWWNRRRRKRNIAVTKIQRLVRGHLGRGRAKRIYAIREEMLRKESLLLWELLQREVVADVARRVAKEVVPHARSMDIHVDVDSALLDRMTQQGAPAVVQWCLDNAIIQYRSGLGYRAGAIVQQVVRSVDEALHPASSAIIGAGTAGEGGGGGGGVKGVPGDGGAHEKHEKVIALRSWDEGEGSDTPTAAVLPCTWGDLVYERMCVPARCGGGMPRGEGDVVDCGGDSGSGGSGSGGTANTQGLAKADAVHAGKGENPAKREASDAEMSSKGKEVGSTGGPGLGAAVSVAWHPLEGKICLTIATHSELSSSSTAGLPAQDNTNRSNNERHHRSGHKHHTTHTKHTYFLRDEVVISFACVPEAENGSDKMGSLKAKASAEGRSTKDVNELKFRFKNAVVFVHNPIESSTPDQSPPSSPPKSPVQHEKEEAQKTPIMSPASMEPLEAEDAELIELLEKEEEEEVAAAPVTVVHIVLRDPTPPPPPINYDAKAVPLQVTIILCNVHTFLFLFYFILKIKFCC
jgi:hypothetical protein